MAFLDQDTLSTQVTDIKDGFQISGLCKGGGVWSLPQREGILENHWAWGEDPDISGFYPIFLGWKEEEGRLLA